jgi:hypothetical protein
VKLSELAERSNSTAPAPQRGRRKARKPVRRSAKKRYVVAISARGSAPLQVLRCCFALGLSWWGALDMTASERTHAALKRALVTFALTAR